MFEIVWVGDILLADAAKHSLETHGYTWPFAHLRSLMTGDFRIGIAEGPLTDRTERNPVNAGATTPTPKRQQHSPRWVSMHCHLRTTMFSIVARRALGIRSNTCEAAGIRHFGAGMDDAQAAAPLLIETPHGVVAVVGFGDRRRYYSIAS